jgi:arylsulfatase A-like enzyme
MPVSSSRVARAATWVGHSVAVAAVGALAAGIAEAVAADGATEVVGTIGFIAVLAWPVLGLLTIATRLMWRWWEPDRLRSQLVDEHGSAPRLAAWLAYLLIACFVMSWATFNWIRMLSAWTTFKPTVISLAVPPIAIVTGLILVAASRPTVAGLTAIASRLDRRFRARFGRRLFAPKIVFGAAAALLAGMAVFGWRWSVAPRIGYLDLGILVPPAIGVAATALAHAILHRLATRPRAIAATASVVAIAAAIATAFWIRGARPLALLQIWARSTVAAEAIELMFYLEDIRGDIAFEIAKPVLRPATAPRDVVLITIDTVRADRTPLYGGPASMPHLYRLGQRGAVFDAAFAPGNVTRRSIPAIATGVSPTRIKGRVAGWALRLDPRHILLAERFRAAGYDTAGFMCCGSFWGPEHRLGINRGLDHLVIEPDGGKLAAAARTWLQDRAKQTDRPLFLWIHFIEPHNWLQGRNDLQTVLERRAQYDRVLAQVDGYLGIVVDTLSQAPRQPIIAVTADHGQGLGDHGQPFHATDLYDTQIRVPLVIVGPGIEPHRVVEPVGLVGLAPTLLDLGGFVPPGLPQMDGTSFASLANGVATGTADGGYAFAAMIEDRSVPNGMRMVVQGKWKLIESRRGLELYDRKTDPGELANLSTSHPGKLVEMRRLLEQRRAIDSRSPFGP